MRMIRAVHVLAVVSLVAVAGCKKTDPAPAMKSDSTAVDPTPSAAAAAVKGDSTAADTMAKKATPAKKP